MGSKYRVDTWFERDRVMVALYDVANGPKGDEPVAIWWDEAVGELVEDGFLNPRDWLASAVEYARHLGLIG